MAKSVLVGEAELFICLEHLDEQMKASSRPTIPMPSATSQETWSTMLLLSSQMTVVWGAAWVSMMRLDTTLYWELSHWLLEAQGLSATRSTKHILILTRKRLFILEVFSQSAWKQLVSYMAQPKWNLCPSGGLFSPNSFHVQPSRVSQCCYLFYWVQSHPYITCYLGLLLRYNLEMSVEIVYTLKDVSRDPLR